MFPLTHIYCAKRIMPNASPLFLYGTIIPDLPMTGVVSWDVMRERTVDWYGTIKTTEPALDDLAEGMLYHEAPKGIDRFVHGDHGYAYRHGRNIEERVARYFPKKSLDVAHSFVEYAVERYVEADQPTLMANIRAAVVAAEQNARPIMATFESTFHIDHIPAAAAMKVFHQWIRAMDFSTPEAAVRYYTELTNTMRRTEVAESAVGELLEIAAREVRADYEVALSSMIERCRVDSDHTEN